MGISFPKLGGKRKGGGFTYRDLVEAVEDPANPAYAAWYLRPGGRAVVRELAADMYDKFYSPIIQLDAVVLRVNQQLESDSRKYRANLQCIQRYSNRAARSFYSTGLQRRGNWAGGLAYNVTSRSSELDRATDWVVKNSGTLMNATDKKAWKDLRGAIEEVIANRDVTTIDTLDYLHRAAGKVQATARPNVPETEFYGSSAMGSYMLGDVFNGVRALRPQLVNNGRPHGATDFAVFLKLAVIRAHPYGDANGRTGRALYACAQIKHGDYFIPMARDWGQNQLHEQNIDAVVNPGAPDYLPAAPGAAGASRRQIGGARRAGMMAMELPSATPAAPKRDARGRRVYDIGDPM